MHNINYPVFLVKEEYNEFLYRFTTDKDYSYLIKFTRANYFFNAECEPCNSIFEISFYPIDKLKYNSDSIIKKTIFEVINTFITKYDSPILFICDSSDFKHKARAKLFTKWFYEANINKKYVFHFRELIFDDYDLLIGLISYSWDENIDLYLNQIDMRGLQ